MDPRLALDIMGYLLAVAICLHAVEDLQLRKHWQRGSRWAQPLSLAPAADSSALPLGLGHRSLVALSGLRLLLAPQAALEGHWSLWLALIVCSVCVSVRWGGTFNGGSDAMALQLLFVQAARGPLESWSDTQLELTRLDCEALLVVYLAVQVSGSYLVSGLAKLRSRAWRRAQALPWFLAHASVREGTRLGQWLRSSPRWSALATLAVLGFECSFPVVWTNPELCLAYLAAGSLFHLANARHLGLHRFLHLWLAAYPAVFAAAHLLQQE